jgi:peptidoglycan/LPS O-acetylase OafA/YrhL
MMTKKITLRHLAFGLTIYSAVFHVVAMLILSFTTYPDMPYLVILMFRVPAAAFLLTHGCFFALGIWLFISANRELTKLEWLAVAVTLLSGAAEIYFFASFFLTTIPAIADQSALVPIMVWAAAVGLMAWCANRNRRPAATTSTAAPAYLRTLGLITYPLYLTHNIVGTAIIRVLVHAGLDATVAVWVQLVMLVLVCWFICAKVEPAIRGAMTQTIAYFGQLPEKLPASKRPRFSRGLGLRPVPAKMIATLQ